MIIHKFVILVMGVCITLIDRGDDDVSPSVY